MKSNVSTIIRKEFARVFRDRRMMAMLLLPGVMIYFVYAVLGAAIQARFAPDTAYIPVICAANTPDSLQVDGMDIRSWARLLDVGSADVPDVEIAKEKVALREADLFVLFPPDFDEAVRLYDVGADDGPAPNIELYYISTNANSESAYYRLTTMLDAYEHSLANKFDINRGIVIADLATEEETSANIISSIVPMMLIIFLYSGCVSIAPESIAGEKERGTLGALLVSPLKRSQLAAGKIISLGVLALLEGLISATAMILSLRRLVGTGVGLHVNIYGAADYVCLVLVILSTVLLMVTLLSLVSAFAKTVREASMSTSPLMFIVIFIGATAVFSRDVQPDWRYAFVPILNSVQGIGGVFSLHYSALFVVITVLSNLAYACAGGFALTWMFNSEKVMFSR